MPEAAASAFWDPRHVLIGRPIRISDDPGSRWVFIKLSDLFVVHVPSTKMREHEGNQ